MKQAVHRYLWPTVALLAVAFSIYVLYRELRGISIHDVIDALGEIAPHRMLIAVAATLCAYAALAEYDHIALVHLGHRKVRRIFVALSSFAAYALGHSIGASVLSAGVVRYRAYRTQGLSGAEVAVLVAFCAITYTLGNFLLGGITLLLRSGAMAATFNVPVPVAHLAGIGLLAAVAFYVIGSWMHFRPLKLGGFVVTYPRLPVVARQLIVAPLEIICAAGIIFATLPAEGNPGFIVVLGVFIASFSLALLSHAPGGLGVLEAAFVAALSQMDPARVLASLIVFRLVYLIIPLAISLVIVLMFERSQLEKSGGP
jgi:uncharacterized membrane protein YbhN (UPF0104 family)